MRFSAAEIGDDNKKMPANGWIQVPKWSSFVPMLPHGSPHPTELSIRGFGPRFLSPWPLQPRAPDGAGPFFMKLRDPTAALQRPPSMMRLPGIPACGNRSESATRKAAKDLWSDQPVHQCFESVRFFCWGVSHKQLHHGSDASCTSPQQKSPSPLFSAPKSSSPPTFGML